MRGLVGMGLIGAVVAGGIWVHNGIFGSDQKVCDELQNVQMALVAGDPNYEQDALDFEFKQVKDRELTGYVDRMVRVAERYGDAGEVPPRAIVQQFLSDFTAALARCDELGL